MTKTRSPGQPHPSKCSFPNIQLIVKRHAVNSKKSDSINLTLIQGVPKKTQLSGILAITPLWKGLELKVGGVSTILV